MSLQLFLHSHFTVKQAPVRLVIVLSWVCLACVTLVQAQPNVAATPRLWLAEPKVSIDSMPRNSDQIPYIDVDAHSQFKLECEGDRPILWLYPHFQLVRRD
jgi:hypothetical protein